MDDTYHQNPALGSTDIINILNNPAALKKPFIPTEEMNLGSLVHGYIFNQPVSFGVFAYRTGEQRTIAEKEAYKEGKVLVTRQTQEIVTAVCVALAEFKTSLDASGITETPFYSTHNCVDIKAKPDFYDPKTKTLYDLKVTSKSICTARERETFIVGGHYYIQLAHYKDILEKNGYEVEKCVLVVASYAHRGRFASNCGCYVGYLEIDEDYLKYGLQERDRALDIFIASKDKDTKELATIRTMVRKPAYFYLKGDTGNDVITI